MVCLDIVDIADKTELLLRLVGQAILGKVVILVYLVGLAKSLLVQAVTLVGVEYQDIADRTVQQVVQAQVATLVKADIQVQQVQQAIQAQAVIAECQAGVALLDLVEYQDIVVGQVSLATLVLMA